MEENWNSTSSDAPSRYELAKEFATAAFEAGVQRPLNAAGDLMNHALGTSIPRLEVVDESTAQRPSDAARAGQVAGSVVPLITSAVIARGALGTFASRTMGGAITEGALTGAINGGFFTPSHAGADFWTNRARSATIDGGTFAAMYGGAIGLGRVRMLSSAAEELTLDARLVREGVKGFISGTAAGGVNAELHALVNNGRFATDEEFNLRTSEFATAGAVGGALFSRAWRAPNGASIETVAYEIPRTEAKAPEPLTAPKEPEPMARVSFDKDAPIGEGWEGTVYSNGDGSVTKVFNSEKRNVVAIRNMYKSLDSAGVRAPQIFEHGITDDGMPALRMEQIGAGKSLRNQILDDELTAPQLRAIRSEYESFVDALKRADISTDWHLGNLTFHNERLYFLDPGYIMRTAEFGAPSLKIANAEFAALLKTRTGD